MPLIRVDVNQQWDAERCAFLATRLSRAAGELLGKPELYVQVIVAPLDARAAMLHGGAPGPAAFVDVRSIGGLGTAVNGRLAQMICALLAERGVPAERVYLNFLDVPATHWGHNGGTFG